MNPMELMQFSRDLDDFQANHPKVAKFLQIEFWQGLTGRNHSGVKDSKTGGRRESY